MQETATKDNEEQNGTKLGKFRKLALSSKKLIISAVRWVFLYFANRFEYAIHMHLNFLFVSCCVLLHKLTSKQGVSGSSPEGIAIYFNDLDKIKSVLQKQILRCGTLMGHWIKFRCFYRVFIIDNKAQ